MIQMLAGRQISILFEMFRSQRFRDSYLLAQPLSKIDQLATVRTKGAILAIKPCTLLLAGGTLDWAHGFHMRMLWLPFEWTPYFMRRRAGKTWSEVHFAGGKNDQRGPVSRMEGPLVA